MATMNRSNLLQFFLLHRVKAVWSQEGQVPVPTWERKSSHLRLKA